MKTIYGIERHKYAPELNKLWYTDNTFDRVPNCVTIDEAKKYVVKYNVNDSKRYTGYKLEGQLSEEMQVQALRRLQTKYEH